MKDISDILMLRINHHARFTKTEIALRFVKDALVSAVLDGFLQRDSPRVAQAVDFITFAALPLFKLSHRGRHPHNLMTITHEF
jgi:hypothetical protein